LRAIKNTALKSSADDEDKEFGAKRRLNHDLEITALRKLFRSKRNAFAEYNKEGGLIAIGSATLDNDLANIKSKTRTNYCLYKEAFKLTGTYGKEKLEPLFIAFDKRKAYSKIENKTKREIAQKVQEKLASLQLLNKALANTVSTEFSKK